MSRNTLLIVVSIALTTLSAGAGAAQDIYADLVAGIYSKDFTPAGGSLRAQVGAVSVLRGQDGGWTTDGVDSSYWTQSVSGFLDSSEAHDYFGYSLAVGDFNGDLKPDLAIGVPGETVSSQPGAGLVHVVYATMDGSIDDEVWHQDNGLQGACEMYDSFGESLAVGDFNNDGYDDLAIGVPGEDVLSPVVDEAGAVAVIYGSASGLTSVGDELWYQSASGVAGMSEAWDEFGYSVAAGDFDGDGYDDLAIGVPGEDVQSNTIANAGAVHIVYGSSSGGLNTSRDHILTQGNLRSPSSDEPDDHFGSSLAVGDFNDDGYDDLVAGAPEEDFLSADDAGMILVCYGDSDGLGTELAVPYHQGTTNLEDDLEDNDAFGEVLATGDFDGDGYDDLAVGVPWENVSSANNAGVVHVLYGSAGGITTHEDDLWYQNNSGLLGMSEPGDLFGYALASGDWDRDGFDDLAIGVPWEDFSSGGSNKIDAGTVHVLFGSTGGVTTRDTVLSLDYPSVEGTAEAGDHFGAALASMPPIGIQVYDICLFCDGFESGDLSHWD